jgi:HSP20 family protein
MSQIVKFRPLPATKFFGNGFMDEFFHRNLADFIGNDYLVSQPAVNIVERSDAYRIEIAAPGIDKQNFTLSVDNNHVSIEAKREVTTEENQEEKYTRREFRYETFKRSYKLPETVNQDAISAVYENGILLVTLPKKEAVKPQVKTIEIA